MNGSQEYPMFEDAQNVKVTTLTERKRCPKCGEVKTLDEFSLNSFGKNGRRSQCKLCDAPNQRNWYYNNHDMIMKKRKKYRIENRDRLSLAWKKMALEHPERIRLSWRKADKKRRDLPAFKLHRNICHQISNCLHGEKGSRKWEELVGYTTEQLKKHLEKQFVPGMSWKNYGRGGWEVDHIIPVSVFNFARAEDIDFKRCWSLKNLQPLWAIDNIKKYNKLDKPFQPSLTI